MDQGKKKYAPDKLYRTNRRANNRMNGQIVRHTDRNRSPDDRYVIKLSEFKWPYKQNLLIKKLANFEKYSFLRPLCLKKNQKKHTQLIHLLVFSDKF